MATSGTTAFTLDILDIIEEAYEMVGIEARNGYDIKTARRSLDLLMREWGNRGINFWTVKEATETVVASTASFALDADTIDILDAVWRTGTGSTQQDRTMTRMSMPEWASTANKNLPGSPSKFWVNRIGAAPMAYIWPVPTEPGEFVYWKLRSIEDTGTYVNTMDIPARFLTALTTGLAYYLAMKSPNAMDRIPLLQTEYERQYNLAAEEDRERASLWLVPDLSAYNR